MDGIEDARARAAALARGRLRSLDHTLFLDPEQVAAGRTHATLHRSGGARRLSVRRADHAGARDLHQRVGLDEVDISLGEGGTLLLPPSPAIVFRPLPSTRTPATVGALRPRED
jgi:hypothetical protein